MRKGPYRDLRVVERHGSGAAQEKIPPRGQKRGAWEKKIARGHRRIGERKRRMAL